MMLGFIYYLMYSIATPVLVVCLYRLLLTPFFGPDHQVHVRYHQPQRESLHLWQISTVYVGSRKFRMFQVSSSGAIISDGRL